MSECTHDIVDQDVAMRADSLCPLCLQRDLAAAQERLAATEQRLASAELALGFPIVADHVRRYEDLAGELRRSQERLAEVERERNEAYAAQAILENDILGLRECLHRDQVAQADTIKTAMAFKAALERCEKERIAESDKETRAAEVRAELRIAMTDINELAESNERLKRLVRGDTKELQVECAALRAALAQAREALRGLFQLVEQGTLVRDISRDHEDGWAIRQVPLIRALENAKAALAALEQQP